MKEKDYTVALNCLMREVCKLSDKASTGNVLKSFILLVLVLILAALLI